MVLFMSDWGREGALPDYTTKNTSFIVLASYYKSMGIRNHAFMLALVDKSLKGVDPHDPNLSLEVLGKIAKEQTINPWYWFREVARVPSIGGGNPGYLIANRGVIAALWCYFNHVTAYLVQPRQTGKSLAMELLIVYLCEVGCRKTKIGLLTRSERLRTSTLEKIKETDSCLPAALNFQRKDDARNTFRYTVNALGNRFTAYLPSGSEKTADALGRGFTMSNVFGDEIPFCSNAHITIPTLLPTAIAARNEAKKNGGFYGILFLTTAGNRRTKEGAYMYNKQASAARWSEVFFDTEDAEDLEKVTRANSRGTTLRGDGVFEISITMDHRQLGKTDDWLIDAAEVTGSTGDQLRMDYFNEWVAGSSEHPLSPALQAKINAVKRNVMYSDVSKTAGYIIRWYVPQNEINKRMNKNTIITVDSSDSSGGDDIALIISDTETGEVLGTGTFNYTSINKWSKWLFGLLMRFPKTVLCVEKKSSGMAVMDTVVDMLIEMKINPFKRLFNMVVNNYKSNPKLYLEMEGAVARGDITNFYHKHKKHFGFNTSAFGITSRNALYGNLKEAVTLTGHLIADSELKGQLLDLVEHNNRIDHTSDGSDDLVIAWLLAYWVMTQGSNLSYYGLDPLVILRRVPIEISVEVEEDPTALAHALRQEQLKDEIIKLKRKFNEVKDPAMRYALKRKIVSYAKQIDTDVMSMEFQPEQVLQSLKDDKMLKRDSTASKSVNTFGW